MSKKTGFSSVIDYALEIFLVNIGLLVVSVSIGFILSTWLSGSLPSDLRLISSVGGFMFFTALSYAFLIPALIYKVIADGVSKGLDLNTKADNLDESQNSEHKDVDKKLDEKHTSEKSLMEEYEYEYDNRIFLAVLISIVIVGILSLIF